MPRILVMQDDAPRLRLLGWALHQDGYRDIDECALAEWEACARERPPACIIIDCGTCDEGLLRRLAARAGSVAPAARLLALWDAAKAPAPLPVICVGPPWRVERIKHLLPPP